MQITQLILNNIRCFAGEQRLRIAPLTLLAGENSTGKSTVLGCYHAMMKSQIGSSPFLPNMDFNIPPYQMGAFPNIARGKADSFSLGMNMHFPHPLRGNENPRIEQHFEFALDKVRFYMRSARFIMPDGFAFGLHFAADDIQHINKMTIHPPDGEPYDVDDSEKELMEYAFYRLSGKPAPAPKNIPSDLPLEDMSQYLSKHAEGFKRLSLLASMAPVRAKPRRVYEPIYEDSVPDGGKIPMELMQLKLTNPDRYEKIRAQLNQFGKSSGLFNDISIKHGRGAGVSFSLQVKVHGKTANLVDVGYGVSQILPIIALISADERGATFLLQQPEVHLHPQAQAAFASLMVSAIAEKGQRFIVETHTDYMMQRASIAIRQGKIAPTDVSLAYFAPKNGGVTIHNIGFDEAGNLTNTPDNYRKFFMEETKRYMGFAD